MKILHTVQNYWPSVGGMQEVVRQLSERFVEAGHQVTVATSRHPMRNAIECNGVQVVDFDITGNQVSGLSGEVEEYRSFVLDGDFDVVVNFAAQQWATDALLPCLEQIRAAKIFVPTGFSALHDSSFRQYFASMPGWMKQYDMNIFLSDTYRDVTFARKHGVNRLIVIPNGADEREFLCETGIDIRTQLAIPPNDLLILLVGSHTGLKGHAEAIEIFRRCRLRRATLLIVAPEGGEGCEADCLARVRRGRFNPLWRLLSKQLQVRSLSRAETVAAYQAADLFLFPSRIECSPLVLFEAMASRTPFLAADVGNSGEIARWSGSGQILPTQVDERGFSQVDVPASARLLRSLCRDPDRRSHYADAGFEAWRRDFTWEKIASRYLAVYSDLCA